MVSFFLKYYEFDITIKDNKLTGGYHVWGPGGLLPIVMGLFMNQTFMTPFFRCFDYWWVLNWNKRRVARNDIADGKSVLTMEEAFKIFEYPKFSVTYYYINITKVMLFTFFYQGIMPLGSLFTLATFFICYWIEKFKMCRMQSYGREINAQIAFDMTELLESIIVIYGFSIFAFDNMFADIMTELHEGINGSVFFQISLPDWYA